MRRAIFLLVLLIALGCTQPEDNQTPTVSIIPQPTEVIVNKGTFFLEDGMGFHAPETFEIATDFLQSYLKNGAGIELNNSDASNAKLLFVENDLLGKEAYRLNISEEKITIEAADKGGAFYAVQSLRQLMDPHLDVTNADYNQKIKLPLTSITDEPKFPYRGMHLDVGRHFFPKEFIKEYISNLAMLKMNYFHWHLTEDQGWRIEIKAYPRLTSHAAYRNETLVGHYNDTPQQFDGERYGGYYTQEDIKEIVAFAQKLNVTIVPEIEMPGHAQAAISAYPELGCTAEPVPVATKWGVFENIFCPNQKTFSFLETVLTEVTELFPGPYVHIGGDEAPKIQWESCNHCQNLIKEHQLADEHELQSWFIKEIEQFLNSKGKQIIGWDEILEGGLAPNATVMSWRGTEGAVAAAKQGNNVILTPTSHCYFDYYQADNSDEPLAIGGYLPLKKVYSFNPIPSELTSEESKHVLGAQGNVWTEYMKTEEQVEYMVFPRILAMSEVTWSGPVQDLDQEYTQFLSRVERFMPRLKIKNINTANHLYEIETTLDVQKDTLLLSLSTPTQGKEIYYNLDGGVSKRFESAIPISSSCVVTSEIRQNGDLLGAPRTDSIRYHLGIGANIAVNTNPHPAYATGGIRALHNGVQGNSSRYGDKEWLGFWGDDLKLDLKWDVPKELSIVRLRFFHAPGQWIYAPENATLSAVLDDGSHLSTTATSVAQKENIHEITLLLQSNNKKIGDSLTLSIPNFGVIPDGKQGAGNKAWTFIDEIIIE